MKAICICTGYAHPVIDNSAILVQLGTGHASTVYACIGTVRLCAAPCNPQTASSQTHEIASTTLQPWPALAVIMVLLNLLQG